MSGSIPKAIRQQVWLKYIGEVYKSKCYISWCKNTITIFSYHTAHCTPRSKGGTIELSNLRPTCPQCNLSMSDTYTIDEWQKLGGHKVTCLPVCFFKTARPVLEKKKKTKNEEH